LHACPHRIALFVSAQAWHDVSMRAVVQRVLRAEVVVESRSVGLIERGLLVLVGVASDDAADDAERLSDKVSELRVFEDDEGKMNLGVRDVGGAILAVSQFTLLGDVRKGRRPSFAQAMEPGRARELFDAFCVACRARGISVETGEFRAHMLVTLTNEGPVTLLIDTKKAF
jgi:D-tyrosyl-tRNA(Tyr) deacylase